MPHLLLQRVQASYSENLIFLLLDWVLTERIIYVRIILVIYQFKASGGSKRRVICSRSINKKLAEGDCMKREGYISWDEYFMGVALLAAQRSKDPSTQVGACIVDDDNRILSTGYNGFPYGCSDDDFPWNRDESAGETKYQFVVHAELNAILNARGKTLGGSKVYVALFPCNECAKAIIQAGIKEVIYLSDKYHDTPSTIASRRMLTAAGVKLTRLEPTKANIVLSFKGD